MCTEPFTTAAWMCWESPGAWLGLKFSSPGYTSIPASTFNLQNPYSTFPLDVPSIPATRKWQKLRAFRITLMDLYSDSICWWQQHRAYSTVICWWGWELPSGSGTQESAIFLELGIRLTPIHKVVALRAVHCHLHMLWGDAPAVEGWRPSLLASSRKQVVCQVTDTHAKCTFQLRFNCLPTQNVIKQVPFAIKYLFP